MIVQAMPRSYLAFLGKGLVNHEENGLGPGFLCTAFVNTTLVLSPFRARGAGAGNPERRG
jgi:hypothetical protein